jgi:hypothetical protein
MRALVFADLQATDGHERCFANPVKSLQLHRLEQFFDQISRIYQDWKCDALWDLGDTTDDRNAIPVPVIDLLCDRFKDYTGEWNLKLIGNHEQYLRDTAIHAGKMFRQFFRVVDACASVKCENVNILCASYQDQPGALTEFLNRHRNQRPNLLLGHFQLFGCQLNSGQSASGLQRQEMEFVNIAFLGHVHKPQSLGQFHYVGSPFQQNWGESGETKRVVIVDIKEGRVGFEFVPLQGFPRYLTVSYPEFVRQVKADSEDRFKVVLRDVQETEAFYAHPLAHHADEATYDYDPAPVSAEDAGPVTANSKLDVMRRYVKRVPPASQGLVIGGEELLELGDQISCA